MSAYYVTAIRDRVVRKTALVSGPYRTHEEALARVEDMRRWANALDPWTAFDAFGTSLVDSDRPGAFEVYSFGDFPARMT